MASPQPHSGMSRLALALVCLGLLIVPLAAWLLMPPLTPTPRARSIEPAAVTTAEPAPSVVPVSAPKVKPSREGPAAREVTGTVEDPDGRTVVDAVVTCEPTAELTATTDRAGRYTLGAEADGCEAVARHPAFLASEPVRLAAGSDNVLRLQRGGGLRGVVVDAQGTPVAKYTLTIGPYSTRRKPFAQEHELTQTVDDASGAFARDGLAPGQYVVTAQTDGRPPTRSDPIVIEAGAMTDGVRIVLSEGATLTGKVTDAASHEPIAGATITIGGPLFEGREHPTATTDAAGVYTVANLPTGRLSISASREGYRLRVMPGVVTESGGALEQDVELSQSDAGRGVESSGVGLVLGVNKKGIIVILVLPYSAAARAGLAAGDQVLAIDGTSTEDLPLSDAIVRTMGPAGSSITLRVARGDEPPRDVVLTCEAMTL